MTTPTDARIEAAKAGKVEGWRTNDEHYLRAIKHKLKVLYELSEDNPRYREQISDETDWIDAKLGDLPASEGG